MLFTIFILLVVLKLAGVITWSWWLVSLPMIVQAGIFLLWAGFIFLYQLAVAWAHD